MACSLEVSRVSRLQDAHVLHGSVEGFVREGVGPALLDLSARCWGTTGPGDFWIHLLVAEGKAEAAVEPEAAIWDVAALKLIVEEAVGVLLHFAGRNTPVGGNAVSTNGLLHDERSWRSCAPQLFPRLVGGPRRSPGQRASETVLVASVRSSGDLTSAGMISGGSQYDGVQSAGSWRVRQRDRRGGRWNGAPRNEDEAGHHAGGDDRERDSTAIRRTSGLAAEGWSATTTLRPWLDRRLT